MWNRRKMFRRDFSGDFWREFVLTPRRIPFFSATQISSCWCSTTHLVISHSTSIWCHRFPGINTGAPKVDDKNVFSGEPSQWKPESQVLESFTHRERECRKTKKRVHDIQGAKSRIKSDSTGPVEKLRGFLKSSSFFSAVSVICWTSL